MDLAQSQIQHGHKKWHMDKILLHYPQKLNLHCTFMAMNHNDRSLPWAGPSLRKRPQPCVPPLWSFWHLSLTALQADSMPNLENLKPRAQAANTAIAPQSEPTEQAMGQIEEDEMDHPMLLPIDEAFTPPGTPKLLELSTPRPVADSETVLTLSEIPRADTVPAKYNHNADILPDEIWQQVMDRLEPTPPIQDEIPLAPFAVQMKREKRKTSTSSHASINEIMVNVPEPVPKKRQKRGRPRKETTTVNAQSQSSAEAQDGEGVEIITVHADNPLVADDNDFSAPDILEVAQETQQLEHMAAETPTTTVEKKKRGRQSKTKICIAVDIPYDSGIADESLDALPKVDHVEKKLVKKRGRPKKAIGDKDAEQPETKILEVADHAVSNADAIEGVDQNFDSQCDVENVPNKPASPDIVCNEVVSDKAMMVQLESKKAISKAKAGLAQVLKTATNHRVGLSRRMRIPSLLKVVRK